MKEIEEVKSGLDAGFRFGRYYQLVRPTPLPPGPLESLSYRKVSRKILGLSELRAKY